MVRLENIEVYANDIEQCIEEYKELHPHIDITKSQSQWNATLKYIYRKLFKPEVNQINNRKGILDYTDAHTVIGIIEYYIELCNLYNRECSLMGIHNMLGISRTIIYDYMNDRSNKEISSLWLDIYKKIERGSEESLRNRAYDNGNVTGTLALLNHDFAYNMPGVRNQEKQDTVRLERSDVVQIEQKHPVVALPGDSQNDSST